MGPRAFVVVIAAVLVVGMSACSPSEPPAPEPSPSASLVVGSEQSPPPTPDAAPTAGPEPSTVNAVPETCDGLLTVEAISGAFGEGWRIADDRIDPADAIPGPAARAAATEATSSLSCLWWPEASSEGHLAGLAFVLDPIVRDDLLTGLSEATSYEQLEVHSAPAFRTSEVKGDLRYTTVYAFVDDVWVVIYGPIQPAILTDLTGTAVARLHATAG